MDDEIASEHPSASVAYHDDARDFGEAALTREQLRTIAEPMIARRTRELCLEHCQNQRYNFHCTVDAHWGLTAHDAPLCDRANETYDWMFRDLLGGVKPEKFARSSSEGVAHYFSKTVRSEPFYERFKDMRFGGRVRVPAYVKAVHPLAHRVFWLLRKQEPIAQIAQALQQPENTIQNIARGLRALLHEQGSSHLLQPVATLSLDALNEQQDSEWEIACDLHTQEQDIVRRDEQERARAAYTKLTWQEQFLIDAMNEGVSAKATLQALAEEGVILDGMDIDASSDEKKLEQRLYYLKRKALARLKELFDKEVRAISAAHRHEMR